MTAGTWTLDDDLHAIDLVLAREWSKLDDARIFMTGGTGFIGRWMLEALAHSGCGARVTILSRDPDAFAARAPHLAARFELVRGDVLELPQIDGEFTHVVHAATDASADLNENNPLRMFETAVEGTRRTLEFARACKSRRVFFMSSGAVYGAQPQSVEYVVEDYAGSPDLSTHRSAYGEGKRAAEMLCAIYRKQFGLDIVTARIFALLGPFLTLDIHFAAGNFILDAIEGRAVTVKSDGLAVRSYLYAGDLTEWLWAMIARAPANATYNVGSEEAVSIGELAARIARLLGDGQYEILGKPDMGWNHGRYVPSTAKIRNEMGLAPRVGLDEAIRRTAVWNGWDR